MRGFSILIYALMVLVVWSGSAAHAAEAVEPAGCIETSVESGGHGSAELPVPADTDKSTPHHHSACHGHVVTLSEADAQAFTFSDTEAPHDWRLSAMFADRRPDSALRPPIA